MECRPTYTNPGLHLWGFILAAPVLYFFSSGMTTTDQNTLYQGRAVAPAGFRKALLLVLAVLVLGFFPARAGAEGPAVSGLNVKTDGLFGSLEGEGAALGLGSLSFPLGKRVGFQADGGIGEISADGFWGGAGHFFMRDPDRGLIGLIGLYQEVDNLSLIRNGAELEWYKGRFSLRARAGYQYGDVRHGAFAGLEGAVYLTDNLMLELEPKVAANEWLARVGVEYMLHFESFSGLALFAEGGLGESGYEQYFGGIRLYLGPNKSLKRRHREDDPGCLLPEGIDVLIRALCRRKGPPPGTGTCAGVPVAPYWYYYFDDVPPLP